MRSREERIWLPGVVALLLFTAIPSRSLHPAQMAAAMADANPNTENALAPCSPYSLNSTLDTSGAEEFREAALSCREILVTTSRIADVRWPLPTTQPDVQRTWPDVSPSTEADARRHTRQLTPDTVFRLLREYCAPAAPGLTGWRPCDVPADDPVDLKAASPFHTRLTCTRPIGQFDTPLSCVPFDLSSAPPLESAQTITRNVDAFRANQHARLPVLSVDTRFDPTFCDRMFRLIERLGTADHAI